jgi:hypothetical protein
MLSEGEVASIQRLIDYLDIVKTPHKNTADQDKLYNDFKSFFEQYDIRRNKNFVDTFPGPIADWYTTLKAEVPNKDDILSGKFGIEVINASDPATQDEYAGGDDAHEKTQPGWNTETDSLGS